MPMPLRSLPIRMLATFSAALLGACGTLPELTPAGAGVRLASADAVGNCVNLGKVTASVMGRFAGIPVHPDTVQSDLNVIARNSASNMGADTIVPASKVEDGKQIFDVYRCLRR